MLQVPSIDCHVRRCRLNYFSRLSRANCQALEAALQTCTSQHGKLPWVELDTKDLTVLCAALPRVFARLPPPDADLAPYWQIAKNQPSEWKGVIRQYFLAWTTRPAAKAPRNIVQSLSRSVVKRAVLFLRRTASFVATNG